MKAKTYIDKKNKKDNMMFEKICEMSMILGLGALLCGCMMFEPSDQKVADMEFSVVDAEILPEEIKQMIEEKKGKAFWMAYHEEEHTYIILGYGIQETSGYRIQVNDVYQGEDSIWVDTDLIGPAKSEKIEETATYPYVIIQTPKIDQTIRFNS